MIAAGAPPGDRKARVPRRKILALGIAQIFAWGATFYAPAVLGVPIAAETGWPFALVVGGLSLSLLVAGGLSPSVGRYIARNGGRSVLPASSCALAIGLVFLGLAQSEVTYLLAWAVIGVGMSMGLYDAVFAALGRQYGAAARSAITGVTLVAGFSSTLTWPLSALLLEPLGWRGVLFVFAGVQLGVCLPLYAGLLPRVSAAELARIDASECGGPASNVALLVVLAGVVAATSAVTAVMSVYLPLTLEDAGFDAGDAIAAAALLGPAQVASRLVEYLFGSRYRAILTLIAALALIIAGLILLHSQATALVGVVAYGAGVGIAWVARGTVPLSFLRPGEYARAMGWIGLAGMISLAAAPTLAAFAVGADRPRTLLGVLLGIAVVGLFLTLGLLRTRAAAAASR